MEHARVAGEGRTSPGGGAPVTHAVPKWYLRFAVAARRVIVLSDVHLAAKGAGGSEEDRALVGLLERLVSDKVETELVLAGDVFDLLLDPHYDAFSSELAIPRLERIFDAHPEFEGALAAFGKAPGCSIVLLSGNHDPEVALPEVRAWIAGRLRVQSVGEERELVAREGETPPVVGHAVGPVDAPIWIVHGDRWDLENHVDRGRLLETGALDLPLGSRLVIEVLRGLRANGYDWVYWLKPEVSAVVPLLLYLDPVQTWKCVGAHQGLTARLLVSQIRTLTRATALLGVDGRTAGEREPSWVDDLAATVDGDRDGLLAQLQQALEHGHPPTHRDALTGHGGLRKWLMRAWLRKVRQDDRFLEPDGPDAVRTRAQRIVPATVQALVVGHTHGPRSFDDPPYANTGTWLPVARLPDGTIEEVIDAIERGELRGEAPRSYAEIRLDAEPMRVRLRHCDADGQPLE